MEAYWSVKAISGKWPKKYADLGRFAWEQEDVVLPTNEDLRYWKLKYGIFDNGDGKGYNA